MAIIDRRKAPEKVNRKILIDSVKKDKIAKISNAKGGYGEVTLIWFAFSNNSGFGKIELRFPIGVW